MLCMCIFECVFVPDYVLAVQFYAESDHVSGLYIVYGFFKIGQVTFCPHSG